MVKNKYKITTGLKKSLIRSVIIGIPIILTVLIGAIPLSWKEMTLGSALIYVTNFVNNWAKNK